MSSRDKPMILIVDDEEPVRDSLRLSLELDGYYVCSASDGVSALAVVASEQPDLVILDVNMPRKGGFQACQEIRAQRIAIPIILLTERQDAHDKVLGLDLGADDYVAKPYKIEELLARVRALLRRSSETFAQESISFGNVVVDFKAYKASKGRESLALSAREFRLLQYLVKRRGIVVSREELLNQVWGYNVYPTTRTVDNHVARLRNKVEDNCEQPQHILTVHGVGYKFVA
jgi:DNA-binding response OmpR family regulator